MDVGLNNIIGHLRVWTTRVVEFARSRRAQRGGLIALGVVAFLGIASYFGVPPLLRHIVTGQLAATLHRPVTVGKIRFNLYTLRLDVDQLHVGEREGSQPFVDVGHLDVRASWTSLFRFAPVVRELTIDKPAIHVVRTGEQRFNFSDLLESPTQTAVAKSSPPAKPQRFAFSNIRIRDGEIRFDDQVLGEQHAIEHIQIGVPFIANLPADVDIFVQPLLQMVVDGSPMHIGGKAKPFALPPESVVDLRLHRLDLHRYVAYLPKRIPIKIPQGALSCNLQLHFVNGDASKPDSRPLIRLGGTVALDQLAVLDRTNSPLLELTHAVAKVTDIEPLGNVIAIDKIRVEGLAAHLVVNRDGTNNIASLTAGATASSATPPPPTATITETPPTKTPTEKPATAMSLDSFELTDSAVTLTDNADATPARLALEKIHVTLNKLRIDGKVPADFDVTAKVASGGSLAVKGMLDLSKTQGTADVSLEQLDLHALNNFARLALAGDINSGKLNAHAKVLTHFGSQFNLHAEPADISLDDVALASPDGHETPVGWTHLSTLIGRADLAARQATVSEVRAEGLHLSVHRGHHGELNLLSLLRTSAPPPPSSKSLKSPAVAAPKAAAPAGPPAQPWQYQIASVAIEKTEAHFQDDSMPRPVQIAVAPLNIHLKDVSSDFRKPFGVDVDGILNKGSFKITGTAAVAPLKASLHVNTKRLDITAADPYVTGELNAVIKSASLTTDGALDLSNLNKFSVSYRGDATLGNVRVIDKLTGDPFVNWKTFKATRIDANVGAGAPKISIGGLALASFYARVILRDNGRLNLKDIQAKPQAAPTSLTREQQPQPAAPTQEPIPVAPSVQTPAAQIEIGGITLKGGNVNYTDNFIKPHYTADLSDISGSVGAFGTQSSQSAAVSLDGKVNDSAPLDINGLVNPLAPMAFLDIRAKADGVDLTGLTPYSTNYGGYPIIKGTLTLDIHYVLDRDKLTAENHIFIDQLTFGDKVEGPNSTNLPLRLAVALMKNSKGQIDVSIPVSGSLSDPKFSVGDAILSAFLNLIMKAITSPFSLLASAVGGITSGGPDLSYVEFAPGSDALTPESLKNLATIASALQKRPAVRLDISGRVDPAFDRDGLREETLAKAVRAQKAIDLGKEEDEVEVAPSEYDKYLTRAYRAAKFTKETNAFGLTKSLPPDEMKKLMLANIQVTDADLHHLAAARGAAVRKWLSAKVDPARLFAVAPKYNADGIKDKGKTTRVDLSLE